MLLLAGDIGGTKTELALYDKERGEVDRKRFVSAEFSGLVPLVTRFLRGRSIGAAALAIAGPIRDGICRTTNLPWIVDARQLARELGAPTELLNDFAAVMLGIAELAANDFVSLNTGERDPTGPIAAIGAGTGLGEGVALPVGESGLRILPSEGGHRHFAPRDELEQALLAHLRARLEGRVSVERVVSGPGLLAIYEFIIAEGIRKEDPTTRARMHQEDPSAVISELGRGEDPACSLALARFIALYGAEAGDLALTVLPTGGLYVAGGIAPKLIGPMTDGAFLANFLDKGRMSDVLRRIPIDVVTNPLAGLFGARRQACMMVETQTS